jgi:hypothetical protein
MTMFQQRHFEAIAQMMQETKPDALANAHMNDRELLAAINQWHNTRKALCDLFERHNHNFMKDRFAVACEPGANVRARGTQRARGSGFSATSHGR